MDKLLVDLTCLCASLRGCQEKASDLGKTEIAGRLGLRLNRLLDEKQAVAAIIDANEQKRWSFKTFDDQYKIGQMIRHAAEHEMETTGKE